MQENDILNQNEIGNNNQNNNDNIVDNDDILSIQSIQNDNYINPKELKKIIETFCPSFIFVKYYFLKIYS